MLKTRGEIIAYLHGAMHDASLNKKKRIRFCQKYPEWLKTIQKMLSKIGFNSWLYKEGKQRNVYVLETTCSKLSFYFDPLKIKNKDQMKAYIKGFFDAEGGIPRNKGKFYIQLVQKNKKKVEAIKQMLLTLGIATGQIHNPSKSVDPNYWRIFVSTKSHKRFASKIGSFHPIKSKIFKIRKMI